jgi:lipoprotein signal peptidase
LRTGTVSLGLFGAVHLVETRIWWLRPQRSPGVAWVWTVWSLAATLLATVAALTPVSPVFVGVLLGGSLSHAIETSVRGGVSDYICLRFWPAFNLADVAITVGALGVLVDTWVTIGHALR